MVNIVVRKPIWVSGSIKVYKDPKLDWYSVFVDDEYKFYFAKGKQNFLLKSWVDIVKQLPDELVKDIEFYCYD